MNTRNFQNVKYQKKGLYCEFEEIKCAVQFVAKFLFRNDAGINRLFTWSKVQKILHKMCSCKMSCLVATSFCTILQNIFQFFFKMCKFFFSNLHTDFRPRKGAVKQEKHPFETNNFLNNGLFSRKTNNHLLWMQIFQGANFLHLCKTIIFYTESKSTFLVKNFRM